MKEYNNEIFRSVLQDSAEACKWHGIVDDRAEIRAIRTTFEEWFPRECSSHLYDDRCIANVEPAIYLSSILKQFLGVDFRGVLSPPESFSQLPPQDRARYMNADALLFCYKLGSANAISCEKMADMRKATMLRFKQDYHSLIREPIFSAESGPLRSYKIYDVNSIVYDRRELEVNYCTHECVNKVDPVCNLKTVDSTYVKYVANSLEGEEKNGRAKLMTMELLYLSSLILKGIRFDTVVYLGSSPGFHIPYLARAYPNVRFVCVDKRAMQYNANVEWYYADDELSFSFLSPLLGVKRKKVCIISDIYIKGGMARQDAVVQNYISRITEYADVVSVMDKFPCDYSALAQDSYANAEYFFQPFLGRGSGELRRVYDPASPVCTVLPKELENKLSFFNQYVRPYSSIDGECYDCGMAAMAVKVTYAMTGCDLSKEMGWIVSKTLRTDDHYHLVRKYPTRESLLLDEGKPIKFKGRMYTYAVFEALQQTCVVFDDGGRVHLPPLSNYDHDALESNQLTKHDEHLLLVNRAFIIKVPTYFDSGGAVYTSVYGKTKPVVFHDLACFTCPGPGNPPSIPLAHCGFIKAVCGCEFEGTSVAAVAFPPGLG